MQAYEDGRFADVPAEQIAAVRSPAELAAVIAQMREDLLCAGQHEWENPTLEPFLEALAAVAVDGQFKDHLTWVDLAGLMVTASGYE